MGSFAWTLAGIWIFGASLQTYGTARLVGTNTNRIVAAVTGLLDDDVDYARMARAHNPYGDGQATRRILEVLRGHQQRWCA